jgi:hypothetical protein
VRYPVRVVLYVLKPGLPALTQMSQRDLRLSHIPVQLAMPRRWRVRWPREMGGHAQAMTIRVKVIPRSARSEIAGELPDGTLEKLAHNGLAGRGQLPRVSHSFDAAPGACALSK